ncbi:MAG: ribose 5-phosphate isomerase B [Tissierellales bacterium]|jgi:ribose 5-phosphate isomerase B|nr:ribose 5-phosphate isomerase B [Tissierellales bacterium]
MKIGIGSDHGGFELKEHLRAHLEEKGFDVKDYGTYSEDSVDYPEIGKKVANGVIAEEVELAILVCGTGIGIGISANKVPGIRCAICSDVYSARMSRAHNNANMISIGGRVVGRDLAFEIIDTWLNTEFEGGRHARRVGKIEG